MFYISALAHVILGPKAMSGRPVEHARAIVNESKRKQWLEFLELERTLKFFYANPFAL